MRALAVAGVLLLSGAASAAGTPAENCRAAQAEAAGKYAACRARADKKLALLGDTAAHDAAIAKCDDKLAKAWQKSEAKAAAAGGACPGIYDEAAIGNFLATCTDAVSAAVAGVGLPSSVVTCQSDLITCGDDLTSCESDLAVAELCGNAAVDANEDCDLGTLNGATCVSRGFAGGVLSCSDGCHFDTSGCYAARFVDNADGTISDNETGLMWEKKIKLDGGSPDYSNRQDADNYYRWANRCSVNSAKLCQPSAAAAAACAAGVEGINSGCDQCGAGEGTCTYYSGPTTVWQWLADLNASAYGGHSDWTLPKVSQLQSLLDYADTTPPAVNAAFHGASCGAGCGDATNAACACTHTYSYWSSSSVATYPYLAWVLYFGGGSVYGDDKGYSTYARAVRVDS